MTECWNVMNLAVGGTPIYRKRSIYNSFAFRHPARSADVFCHPARSADVGFSRHTTLWWWAPTSTQYFVVYAKMYP